MVHDMSRWPTGRMLASASRRVGREWNTHLAAWDLNHASLPVLVLLSRDDHSQRELAAAMSVTEQTMSRILARMERTGYITRTPHGNDKRRHVISLSAAGESVVREAADPVPAEEMVSRGLTPEQVVQLRGLLALIIRAHDEPADTPPGAEEPAPGTDDLPDPA